VRLPGMDAVLSSSEHPRLYESGVRRRPWTQVYTSRGIGTTRLHVRFLARPEVALLTLTGAERPARPGRQRPVS
jgi:predicted MPP superfamily phosphohydrolase